MLNSEDVAYIVAMLEKAPSFYPRRKQIALELHEAWRQSQRSGNPYRIPIAPSMTCGVVEIDAFPYDRKSAVDKM